MEENFESIHQAIREMDLNVNGPVYQAICTGIERASETALAREALAEAIAETRSGLILVVGPYGAGKTKLTIPYQDEEEINYLGEMVDNTARVNNELKKSGGRILLAEGHPSHLMGEWFTGKIEGDVRIVEKPFFSDASMREILQGAFDLPDEVTTSMVEMAGGCLDFPERLRWAFGSHQYALSRGEHDSRINLDWENLTYASGMNYFEPIPASRLLLATQGVPPSIDLENFEDDLLVLQRMGLLQGDGKNLVIRSKHYRAGIQSNADILTRLFHSSASYSGMRASAKPHENFGPFQFLT